MNQDVVEQLGEDLHVEEHRVMCLQADKFKDLCELYPQTAQSLQIQGLKKRNLFINCLRLQEEEAQHQAKNPLKQGLTTVVYKGLMKAHSKYRDKLTRELEEDEELTLMLQTQHNGTILSSQILMPEE